MCATGSDVVHKTPHELGIGIYDAAVAVRDSTPLVKVFDALFEFKLKALPIVDADNVVVNVYHRGEVVYLARDPMLHRLDGSVADAIAAQKRDVRLCVCVCVSKRWRRRAALRAGATLFNIHTHLCCCCIALYRVC